MPRTANKFPKTLTIHLEGWMMTAIEEAAIANDRTPEQEIRARLREGLEPPVGPIANGRPEGLCAIEMCSHKAAIGALCAYHANAAGMSLGD